MSYHTAYPNWDCPGVVCFCIPLYVHQQLLSHDCQYFAHITLQCFLPILGTLLVQGFIFERGPTIFKMLKNTICIGVCTIKCAEKPFIPFTPLHFLPKFVPHTVFKGSPGYAFWNVLYIFQKLCAFQPSSPLYSIHPLRLIPNVQ